MESTSEESPEEELVSGDYPEELVLAGLPESVSEGSPEEELVSGEYPEELVSGGLLWKSISESPPLLIWNVFSWE